MMMGIEEHERQEREERRQHDRQTEQHHTQIWKSLNEMRNKLTEIEVKQTAMNVLQVQLDQAVAGLEIISGHLEKHIGIDDAAHREIMEVKMAVKTMSDAEELRGKEAEKRKNRILYIAAILTLLIFAFQVGMEFWREVRVTRLEKAVAPIAQPAGHP